MPKVDMKADLCNIRQRDLRLAIELDRIAIEARELADDELLALARRVERDVDLLAPLAREVARLAQDAVDARRGHLQNVRIRHDIALVERLLELLAQRLAILDIDAAFLIDVDAQIPIVLLDILDIDELDDVLILQELLHDCLHGILNLLLCHTSTSSFLLLNHGDALIRVFLA